MTFTHPINATVLSNISADLSVDLMTVIKSSQALSSEILLDQLLAKLMSMVIENAGADKGILILNKQGKLFIEIEWSVFHKDIKVLQSLPVEDSGQLLSQFVINCVARTKEPVVLNDVTQDSRFIRDPYFQNNHPKSLLCVPLINQNQVVSLIYLENHFMTYAFKAERVEVLKLISAQAAIAIENAKLYARLHKSEQTLMQFLEAMPVAVAVFESSGKPYYSNKRAQQLLGKGVVPEATAANHPNIYPIYLIGTEQPYPPEKRPSLRALKGETAAVDDMEIHQSDKIIPIEVWGTPIFDEQNQVVYSMVAFQDITERKQAEADRIRLAQEREAKEVALRMNQEIEAKNLELEQTLQQLRTTQQRLIESEKMAALGNLVAGIAHEINTPVGVGVTTASGLDMLTQRLAELYAGGKMKRSDLDDYLKYAKEGATLILKNLSRAAELVRSFKQVAVDQTGEQTRTFELKHYLQEILLTLQPELKHTPHQVTIICDVKIMLTSYPGAFSQIITNLVINSLVHGFGKAPEVSETEPVLTGQITITANIDNQKLILRYADNGKGIPADIMPHIFDPFFTTNRQGGGSGLGLHIVYNLVTHKLKGSIQCESTVAQGTTFIMEIPY